MKQSKSLPFTTTSEKMITAAVAKHIYIDISFWLKVSDLHMIGLDEEIVSDKISWLIKYINVALVNW